MLKLRAVAGSVRPIDLLDAVGQSSQPDSPITHRRPTDTVDQLIETGHAPSIGSVQVALGHRAANRLRTKDTNVG